MTSQDQRLRGPARALLVIDQRVLVDVVKLALNHGHYNSRVARTIEEASTALADWRPHLVVLDMDIAGSRILERLAEATREGGRLPVIALTRRGDLKAKLAAFERGVDDILTVPFSPEEFVARVLAIMRRSYHNAVVFTPVLRLGDLEIDILNRRVRAGDTELHLTSPHSSRACYICWPPTRDACSRATKSSTIFGARTTLPRATLWTGISATFASSCKIIPGDRGT